MLNTFKPGAILVTPSDRDDVIIAVAMAALNHVPIAGLVVTGDLPLDERVLEFCRTGFDTGLPLLGVRTNSYETATALNAMSLEVPIDDIPRITAAMDFAADHIDPQWLAAHRTSNAEPRLSPAAFCYQLTQQARQAHKRILLPEGSEPRTIRAAAICQTARHCPRGAAGRSGRDSPRGARPGGGSPRGLGNPRRRRYAGRVCDPFI